MREEYKNWEKMPEKYKVYISNFAMAKNKSPESLTGEDWEESHKKWEFYLIHGKGENT